MEPETDLQQLVIHDFPEDQALRRRSENKRQTSAGPKNPGENLDYAKRNMVIIIKSLEITVINMFYRRL